MALVYEVATLRSKIVAACRASFTPHRGACERGWTQQEAGACALTKWGTSLSWIHLQNEGGIPEEPPNSPSRMEMP